MYPGFKEYEQEKAQAKLGLKPWLKWPSVIKEREKMDYQDQVAIGTVFNAAIKRVLDDYGISLFDQPGLVSGLAQTILIELDQSGYKIVRK